MAANIYRVKKEIGKGSYGRCVLVSSTTTDKELVIKEVDLTPLSPAERKKAHNEARLLSQLNHPNIIRFQEVYKTRSGKLHIVMEYASKGNLHAFLESQNGGCLSENEVVYIMAQLFLALKYLHERNILHRDIKPENVLLMLDGTVKLADFGISKALDSPAALAQTYVGSPGYLSPEQWEEREYGFPADIWSAGVLMYELCAQKRPFHAKNPRVLSEMVRVQPHPPLPPSYSQQLSDLLNYMLRKDPASRPSVYQLIRHPLVANKLENYQSDSIRRTQRYPIHDFPMQAALPRIRTLSAAILSGNIPSDKTERRNLLREVRERREELSRIEIPESGGTLQVQEMRDMIRNYLVILDIRQASLETEESHYLPTIPPPPAQADIDVPDFPEVPSQAAEIREQLRAKLTPRVFDQVYEIITRLKSREDFRDHGISSYRPHLQHLLSTTDLIKCLPMLKLLYSLDH